MIYLVNLMIFYTQNISTAMLFLCKNQSVWVWTLLCRRRAGVFCANKMIFLYSGTISSAAIGALKVPQFFAFALAGHWLAAESSSIQRTSGRKRRKGTCLIFSVNPARRLAKSKFRCLATSRYPPHGNHASYPPSGLTPRTANIPHTHWNQACQSTRNSCSYFAVGQKIKIQEAFLHRISTEDYSMTAQYILLLKGLLEVPFVEW